MLTKLKISLIINLLLTVSTFAQRVDTLGIAQTQQLLLSHPNITIIDCRDSASFATSHIERAIHLDVNDSLLNDKLSKLDKEIPYLVYCRTNGRSQRLSQIMIKKDFRHIYLFYDGYLKWKAHFE
jgi:rhodanese-related sulfurtransferase